jgi:hypothetical protein
MFSEQRRAEGAIPTSAQFQALVRRHDFIHRGLGGTSGGINRNPCRLERQPRAEDAIMTFHLQYWKSVERRV